MCAILLSSINHLPSYFPKFFGDNHVNRIPSPTTRPSTLRACAPSAGDKFTDHYLAAFAVAEREHRPIDSCYSREDMIAVAVIQVVGIRKRVAAAVAANHGEETVVKS